MPKYSLDTSLATERGLVTDARYLTAPANELSVLYAVFSALPKDVSVVDLQFAFGSTATAIPVTDAPLGPQVAQEFTMLGQGWPAFPSADVIVLADPSAVTFDLASRSQEVSGATETDILRTRLRAPSAQTSSLHRVQLNSIPMPKNA